MIKRFLPALFFSAALLFASIDGIWVAKVETTNKKTGEKATQQFTLDLKQDGSKLTGTVSTGEKKRRRGGATIENGAIEGNKFSFTTVQRSKKKGDQKVKWEGTVEGDELKASRRLENGRRGLDFVAKKQ